MTNKIILSILVLSTLFSCNREDNKNSRSLMSAKSFVENTISIASAVPVNGENDETNRILDDIDNPHYTVAIIDNPNYGKFSSSPEYDILIGGKSNPNISISLDGHTYSPNDEGQWFRQGIEFKQYYGKNVAVTIRDGNQSFEYNIYVPEPILAGKLSEESSVNIEQEGNVLTWEPDPQNVSERVSLFYKLYENDELGSEEGMYKNDILLLDDNGSFSIDELIGDGNCKRIFFKLMSGNTASANFNDEKLLFHISTYDHHEYLIY